MQTKTIVYVVVAAVVFLGLLYGSLGGQTSTRGRDSRQMRSNCPTDPRAANNEVLVDVFRKALATRLTEMMTSKELQYGHSAEVEQQAEFLYKTARQQFGHVDKICEVGFNAGHGAVAMILGALGPLPPLDSKSGRSRSSVKRYVAFDTAGWEWTKPTFEYLKSTFTNVDMHMEVALSAVGMQAHAEELARTNGPKCDLAMIDADHSYQAVVEDLAAMRALVDETSVVLMDDCGCDDSWSHCTGVNQAVEEAEARGEIRVEKRITWNHPSGKQNYKGMCVVRYLF